MSEYTFIILSLSWWENLKSNPLGRSARERDVAVAEKGAWERERGVRERERVGLERVGLERVGLQRERERERERDRKSVVWERVLMPV